MIVIILSVLYESIRRFTTRCGFDDRCRKAVHEGQSCSIVVAWLETTAKPPVISNRVMALRSIKVVKGNMAPLI